MDVAIIGGGMVGASLALALRDTGINTLLIESVPSEARSQPSFDDRTTALGNASRRIFESLGVWSRVAPEAAEIHTIHVSDAGQFGFARLRAEEQGVAALGYVASNRAIGAALWESLRSSRDIQLRVSARATDFTVEVDTVHFQVSATPGRSSASGADTAERVRAQLVIAADGAQSAVRAAANIDAVVQDYGQTAIIANILASRPHDGTAYERFTSSGPLAVLPLRDGSYGVIWTCATAVSGEILAMDDRTFLQQLQGRFGWRAGRFERAGRRAAYPLQLSRASRTVANRVVLIGNAAQALHPVAGQGFNLGLRDAAMLAEVLAVAASGAIPDASGQSSRFDVGNPELLQQFASWRSADRSGVIRFTDGLVKLFGDGRLSVSAARNFGLLLFDLTPAAKSALARVSLGFAGRTPRLARGLGVRP